jgi:lipoate-protein ligase A
MTKKWRLILDSKCDGYYNMACDEALFIEYPFQKIPTLRIYGWNKPFFSLGYNQHPQEIFYSAEVPFVRRITGGAVILHDKEITYSLVCALEDLDLPSRVKESYRAICSFLKLFYARLGLEAYFAKDALTNPCSCGRENRPLTLGEYKNFCFSGWQHFDLLVKGKKIGGNAQARKKNIIFQHGSIPQEIDFENTERLVKNTTNLREKAGALNALLSHETDFYRLCLLLRDSFKEAFDIELKEEGLSASENQRLKELLNNKYRQEQWNWRKEVSLSSARC